MSSDRPRALGGGGKTSARLFRKSLASARLLLGCLVFAGLAGPAAAETAEPAHRWRIDRDGIQIDFRIDSLEEAGRAEGLRENQLVAFSFAISDAATGTPLSGVYPAAWMDRLPPDEESGPESCQDKVETFLGGSILSQAEVDLNVYYVLTMNDDATLSVVDPLFGFGGTKLLAMIRLRASASDWALTRDRGRVYVSMPEADAVAVVDTSNWSVLTNIPTAPTPRRMVLQPDGVYLWVGYDEAEPGAAGSGVAVFQPANLAERTRIVTGRGHHEIALSGDNRYAYVTNAEDGTLAVIDVRRLEVVKTIVTGARPASIAWSEAARAVYVAHEGDGRIVAVDGERHEIVARMETGRPGLGRIRAAPGGSLVLAVNPDENLLHVVDASKNSIVQTGPMAGGPDQIAFSDTLAYIRHRDSEQVLMVPLSEIGQPGKAIPVVDFPGGQAAPGSGARPSLADAIVQAPGANAVLVTNPADGMIYYYAEGMAAPMGAFKNYGRQGSAVLVVDNSLRERSPGVYRTSARLRRPGRYDVAFFLDTPRTVHCFPLEIAADPELEKLRKRLPLQVTTLDAGLELEVAAGSEARFTVVATDPNTGEPRTGLEDLQVMAMLAPGQWHARRPARELGEGRYEVSFRVPREGLYYVYAECVSEGLALGTTRPLLYVIAPAAEAAPEAPSSSED